MEAVMVHSKTKTSYYRRLYIAYLIDTGVNTVPKIIVETGMPKRTIQDTIKSLSEMDISCQFAGAAKNGHYEILGWGATRKTWVSCHLTQIKESLRGF
jgi:hypothetical protein